MLTFRERYCPYCLTKQLNNGETIYYHPILEAKLVTANGFAFSMLTEFIENTDPQASKQDCELKSFYRLAARLKQRFPVYRSVCCWMVSLPVVPLSSSVKTSTGASSLCSRTRTWRTCIVRTKPSCRRCLKTINVYSWEHNERWCKTNRIEYADSQGRIHNLNLFVCQDTKPDRHGNLSTTTFKWLTNFIPTQYNVDTLANQGGRFRWKIENEGFNIQKNGGFNLKHPYSQDGTAHQVFFFLLQIAHLIFQLIEKGSLFRNALPHSRLPQEYRFPIDKLNWKPGATCAWPPPLSKISTLSGLPTCNVRFGLPSFYPCFLSHEVFARYGTRISLRFESPSGYLKGLVLISLTISSSSMIQAQTQQRWLFAME
jgi:hypothetical protein